MRGIKSMKTPIFPGNKIYYNFVRPHGSVDSSGGAPMVVQLWWYP
jgi:hypothetical protein